MEIRVLLVDDHQMLREGLRALLQAQAGIEIVGEADNGRIGVALAKKFQPDVVVMDIGMSDLNGIEASRQITARESGVKVLGLSMHSHWRFVTQMLQAGASGYLLKDSASEELHHAIETVCSGHVYLSPAVADDIIKHYLQLLDHSEPTGPIALTAREREVVQLPAEGSSSKQIGGLLHVSVKTVDVHRKNALDKLDLESIAELTKYAIREGLTSLDD